MKSVTVFAISLYKKYISPFLPQSCRFYPSCSMYCREAVERHGFQRGLWFFMKRILKCHPFHHGGYDPVPKSSQRIK
ncbi:MAG: membrane protein insertion efficiency factor YidD [Thermodesulfovibrionia bacterium]|nr:membrane protein insertion efficiency factor YidD [Thermodesulfovibrionia bacterium]